MSNPGDRRAASVRRSASEKQHQDQQDAAAAKAAERPHRPLNAYNLFFADERKRMLREASAHQDARRAKMGFADMARSVSKRWKAINAADKAHYERLAEQDKHRYYQEMNEWYKRNNADDSSNSEKSDHEDPTQDQAQTQRQDQQSSLDEPCDDKKPSARQEDHASKKSDSNKQQGTSLESAPAAEAAGMDIPSHTPPPPATAASSSTLHAVSAFPNSQTHPYTSLPSPQGTTSTHRLNTDAFATALSQQTNLLEIPGDPSNINYSSHPHQHQNMNQAAAAPNAFGPQPLVGTQASNILQLSSVVGGLAGGDNNVALLQMIEGLRRTVRREAEESLRQQQQQRRFQQEGAAPVPSSASNVLNSSIRPIAILQQQVGGVGGHDVAAPSSQDVSSTMDDEATRSESKQDSGFSAFQQQLQSLHRAREDTLRGTAEEEEKERRFQSSEGEAAASPWPTTEVSNMADSSMQNAAAPSSSPPPLGEGSPRRGSIRSQLNNMISMLSSSQQQGEQQSNEGNRQEYNSLASSLGEEAVDFLVDTFIGKPPG